MQPVTSGIQGLDAQLGGGFPSGSTILLLSEPSNAPYLFCEQFAAGGLNALETVYYYSYERPKSELVERLRGMLPKQEVLQRLQLLDCYSVKMRDLSQPTLKRLGIENHAVKIHEDAVARLLKQPKDAPYRLVIESLTEPINAYGEAPIVQMVTALSGVVKLTGGLALILLVKGMHESSLEMKLRHLADGVIEFGVERQGFGLYSYLSVTKMRGVQDATRLLLYKETDKGLWLESTRRVF